MVPKGIQKTMMSNDIRISHETLEKVIGHDYNIVDVIHFFGRQRRTIFHLDHMTEVAERKK